MTCDKSMIFSKYSGQPVQQLPLEKYGKLGNGWKIEYFFPRLQFVYTFSKSATKNLYVLGRGTLKIRYPLWSTFELSLLWYDNPLPRGNPLSTSWGTGLHKAVDQAMGTFTSTQTTMYLLKTLTWQDEFCFVLFYMSVLLLCILVVDDVQWFL